MSIYEDRTPYLYAIGWTQHDRWYLGIRYGKGCNPSDLWRSYFTSSKAVAEFRTAYGEPDHVEVLFTGTMQAVYRAEQEALLTYQLCRDNRWLNKGVQVLEWATGKDALADAARETFLANRNKPKSERGRSNLRKGGRKRARLSETDLRQIAASVEPNTSLAIRFGVSRTYIENVKKGKTASHITGL